MNASYWLAACVGLSVLVLTACGCGGPSAVPVPMGGSPRPVAFDGASNVNGSGLPLAPKEGTTSEVVRRDGAGENGASAIVIVAKGTGAVGGRWIWASTTADSTDVTSFRNLVLRLKVDGTAKPQSLQASLYCTCNKASPRFDLGFYSPQFADGQWHDIVIPLADLAGGKDPYNPHTAAAIEFVTSGRGRAATDFTIAIARIAFDNRPSTPRNEIGRFPATRPAKPLAATAKAVTAEVNNSAAGTPISQYIYGGTSSTEDALELGLTTIRYGGNPTSTVDWKTGFFSSGADWYWVNNPYTNQPRPPKEGYKAFGELKKAGLELYMTFPIMGRVSKDGISSGWDIRKYPDQTTWEGKDHPGDLHPNAGSGERFVKDADGQVVIDPTTKKPMTVKIPGDPDDVSIPQTPDEQTALLSFLIKDMGYGTSDKGGLRYLCLDNEPMIWHETHRHMHPEGCSYDEYWQRTVDYAGRLKKIDPSIQIAGPALFGWTAYFYSGKDMQLANGKWDSPPPDFAAHGKVPFTKWWLTKLAEYEKANHVRLVDILDWHFYPSWPRGKANDPDAMEAVVQETRVWWDPTWKEPSWIGAETNHIVRLVRLMKEWIAGCNPGMKTCIGEYSCGGGSDASGGVAMAELLGVWGREGLDMAYMWGGPGRNTPQGFGFRMFRNPDGKHTVYGDRYLPVTWDAPDDVSVHAARDSKTGRLTFVLVNKRGRQDAAVTIRLAKPIAKQSVTPFEYTTADARTIGQLPAITLEGKDLKLALPAMSVLRFDVEP